MSARAILPPKIHGNPKAISVMLPHYSLNTKRFKEFLRFPTYLSFSLFPRKWHLFVKYPPSEWTLSFFLTTMSFLSSSISSSSLSSLPSTSPPYLRHIFPTYLLVFAAHSLYAAIFANSIILHIVEDLPLFHKDLICQELVLLFHNVSTTQRYHALAAP